MGRGEEHQGRSGDGWSVQNWARLSRRPPWRGGWAQGGCTGRAKPMRWRATALKIRSVVAVSRRAPLTVRAAPSGMRGRGWGRAGPPLTESRQSEPQLELGRLLERDGGTCGDKGLRVEALCGRVALDRGEARARVEQIDGRVAWRDRGGRAGLG